MKIQRSLISFQTSFVRVLLLIVHTWNSSPLEVISSGFNALVVPFQQFLEGPMEVLLCERANDLRHSLFHLHNCLITTASKQKSQGARYDYRDAEGLSWCPYLSNSQWQEWSCGLVHCLAENASDPIWRVPGLFRPNLLLKFL